MRLLAPGWLGPTESWFHEERQLSVLSSEGTTKPAHYHVSISHAGRDSQDVPLRATDAECEWVLSQIAVSGLTGRISSARWREADSQFPNIRHFIVYA